MAHARRRQRDIFVDHRRNIKPKRFLPEATNFSWVTLYSLPDEAGTLTIDAKSAQRVDDADVRVVQLTVTVRGKMSGEGKFGVRNWFDVAHNYIVKGFADSTDLKIQSDVWRKK